MPRETVVLAPHRADTPLQLRTGRCYRVVLPDAPRSRAPIGPPPAGRVLFVIGPRARIEPAAGGPPVDVHLARLPAGIRTGDHFDGCRRRPGPPAPEATVRSGRVVALCGAQATLQPAQGEPSLVVPLRRLPAGIRVGDFYDGVRRWPAGRRPGGT